MKRKKVKNGKRQGFCGNAEDDARSNLIANERIESVEQNNMETMDLAVFRSSESLLLAGLINGVCINQSSEEPFVCLYLVEQEAALESAEAFLI